MNANHLPRRGREYIAFCPLAAANPYLSGYERNGESVESQDSPIVYKMRGGSWWECGFGFESELSPLSVTVPSLTGFSMALKPERICQRDDAIQTPRTKAPVTTIQRASVGRLLGDGRGRSTMLPTAAVNGSTPVLASTMNASVSKSSLMPLVP